MSKHDNFELVEPGFVSIRPVGMFTQEHMSAMLDSIQEAVENEPFFMIEADVSELEGLTPESRRVAAQRLQQLPERAIAIIGGNFRQKIFAKLILTAVSMLTSQNKNVADFFKTKEQAREWLRAYASGRQESE